MKPITSYKISKIGKITVNFRANKLYAYLNYYCKINTITNIFKLRLILKKKKKPLIVVLNSNNFPIFYYMRMFLYIRLKITFGILRFSVIFRRQTQFTSNFASIQ